MKTRETIVISNFWHKPGIKIALHHGDDAPQGGISLETDLEDFIKGVLHEIAHPVKVWTKAGQEKEIREAISATCEKIKAASAQVM